MRHWADPHEPLPPPPPQVEKVNKFTQTLVEKLRSELSKMQSKAVNAEKENQVGASLFNRVLPPPNAPSTGPKILPPLPLLSPQATRDLLLKEAARTSSPSSFSPPSDPPLPLPLHPQATRDLLLKEAARTSSPSSVPPPLRTSPSPSPPPAGHPGPSAQGGGAYLLPLLLPPPPTLRPLPAGHSGPAPQGGGAHRRRLPAAGEVRQPELHGAGTGGEGHSQKLQQQRQGLNDRTCLMISSPPPPPPPSSQGFHKILKKHDKMLPHAPCRQFYVAHLHQQPWVQVRGRAVGVLGVVGGALRGEGGGTAALRGRSN